MFKKIGLLIAAVLVLSSCSKNGGSALPPESPKTPLPPLTLELINGDITLEANDPFVDPGVAATQSDGTDLSVITTGTVDTSILGDYTVEYTVSLDSRFKTVSRVVSVVDTIIPVITSNESTQNIVIGSVLVDNVVANDSYEGDLTSSLVKTGTVDTNSLGNHVVLYDVQDSSGNSATQYSKTYRVIDNPPGSITYPSNTYSPIIGSSIDISPTVAAGGGDVVYYSTSFTFPNGISFNSSTGRISGNFSGFNGAGRTFTITAHNSGGTETFDIFIEVISYPPSGLNYYITGVYNVQVGETFGKGNFVNGSAATYTISPALPTGVEINVNSGTITGTALQSLSTTNYTVTATNNGGSDTYSFDMHFNTDPIAVISNSADATVGSEYFLDGTNSSDNEGDTLSYIWTLIAKPLASSVSGLTNPATANPSFTPDAEGSYVFSLKINDGFTDSSLQTVTINTTGATTEIAAPIATTGFDDVLETSLGNVINLDASGSVIFQGSATYVWSLLTAPAGSVASLTTPTEAQATFTTDEEGTYVFELTVSDGVLASTDRLSVYTNDSGTVVAANTTVFSSTPWEKENSPYILQGDVIINGNFNVNEGVVIIGNGHHMYGNGSNQLRFNGTANNPVILNDLKVGPKTFQPANLVLNHVVMDGGSLCDDDGIFGHCKGGVTLKDSIIKNTTGISYIWFPSTSTNIKRNKFVNASGWKLSFSGASVVSIEDNLFFNSTGDGSTMFAIQTISIDGGSNISGNTFVSNDNRRLLQKNSSSFDARENFFPGLSVDEVIASLSSSSILVFPYFSERNPNVDGRKYYLLP